MYVAHFPIHTPSILLRALGVNFGRGPKKLACQCLSVELTAQNARMLRWTGELSLRRRRKRSEKPALTQPEGKSSPGTHTHAHNPKKKCKITERKQKAQQEFVYTLL